MSPNEEIETPFKGFKGQCRSTCLRRSRCWTLHMRRLARQVALLELRLPQQAREHLSQSADSWLASETTASGSLCTYTLRHGASRTFVRHPASCWSKHRRPTIQS